MRLPRQHMILTPKLGLLSSKHAEWTCGAPLPRARSQHIGLNYKSVQVWTPPSIWVHLLRVVAHNKHPNCVGVMVTRCTHRGIRESKYYYNVIRRQIRGPNFRGPKDVKLATWYHTVPTQECSWRIPKSNEPNLFAFVDLLVQVSKDLASVGKQGTHTFYLQFFLELHEVDLGPLPLPHAPPQVRHKSRLKLGELQALSPLPTEVLYMVQMKLG